MLNILAVSKQTAVKTRIYAKEGRQPIDVHSNKSEQENIIQENYKILAEVQKYIEGENTKLYSKREKRCHELTTGRLEEKIT